MNTILVPTDFSEAAQKAFLYAHTLFGNDVKYVLVNTYVEPRASTASMMSLTDILHKGSVESLSEEMAILKEKLGENTPQIQTVSEYGEAPIAIAKLAELHKADLIVMGTTGATGLKEIMLGSVASGVMQRAKCPVLAVPASERYGAPTNVLLAADLEASLSAASVNALQDICAIKNAKVTVLNVEDPDEPMTDEKVAVGVDIDNALKGINHSFDSVKGENIEMAISRYADLNDNDLIVTIPHHESWLSQLFNPSVSKKLAQHEYRPLLSLPE